MVMVFMVIFPKRIQLAGFSNHLTKELFLKEQLFGLVCRETFSFSFFLLPLGSAELNKDRVSQTQSFELAMQIV